MNDLTQLGILSMIFCVWFTWYEASKKEQGTGQSKRMSLAEAWTNIIIGFTINFIANFWLIPMMTGVDLPHSANFWGGWVYTTVSMLRTYTIRRFFNSHIQRFIQWVAGRFA
jgi:ABC-type Fe3+ transport system permease subunit